MTPSQERLRIQPHVCCWRFTGLDCERRDECSWPEAAKVARRHWVAVARRR